MPSVTHPYSYPQEITDFLSISLDPYCLHFLEFYIWNLRDAHFFLVWHFRVYPDGGTCQLTWMATWQLSADLAMTNKAAMNTHIQVLVWTCPFISLGELPEVG